MRAFEKPKTNPAALRPSTTVLSPYLKFGCVSPALFHRRLSAVYAAAPRGAAVSRPPVSLEGQLLWRDFFITCGSATPNFDRMAGNPICRQARRSEVGCLNDEGGKHGLAFFPYLTVPPPRPRLLPASRQVAWDNSPRLLAAWENSQTGYPWIVRPFLFLLGALLLYSARARAPLQEPSPLMLRRRRNARDNVRHNESSSSTDNQQLRHNAAGRLHGAAAHHGLAAPPGAAQRGLLPHARGPVPALGGRPGGGGAGGRHGCLPAACCLIFLRLLASLRLAE